MFKKNKLLTNLNSPSKFQYFFHEFKKDKLLMFSVAYLCFLLLISLFFVLLFPNLIIKQFGFEKEYVSSHYRLLKCSTNFFFWLGTDELSRSVIMRLFFGFLLSIVIATFNSIIAVTTGSLYGFISGLIGKNTDMFMMYFIEIINAIPYTILLILFGTVISKRLDYMFSGCTFNSILVLFLIFILFEWIGYVKIIRNRTLSLKNQDYFDVSKSLGASNFFILKKHIIPNCVDTIIVNFIECFIHTIISEATLQAFNIGVKQPFASLGNLLSDSLVYVLDNNNKSLYFIPLTLFVSTIILLHLICYKIKKIFKKRIGIFYENK